jgi:hypothetical protein
MTSTAPHGGQDTNQSDLAIALDRVRTALHHYIAHAQGDSIDSINSNLLPAVPTSSSALSTLCHAFNLSAFEQDLLLLCAGVELSGSFAQLCATAQGNAQLTYPTFSLALSALPNSHWSAIAPISPLRHWRLIEVVNGDSLTQSRLRIDERVLHYLNGVLYLDDRLRGWVEPLSVNAPLPPSYQTLVDRIVNGFTRPHLPVIQLCGSDRDEQESIAAAACTALGLQLYRLQAADLPTTPAERDALTRLWQREAILSHSALLIESEANVDRTANRTAEFLEAIHSPLFVATHEPLLLRHPTLRLEVRKPTAAEQRHLWQVALGQSADLHRIDAIAAQFNLSAVAIQSISTQLAEPTENTAQPTLWNACRTYARTRLDDLAQHIQPVATWEDLVLPELQQQTLREIAAQVRQRSLVYDTWGIAARSSTGLGISALFAGASGTGKTLAAEVLAQTLQLDLYRIDLSQVVSKYIGETEKNLRRVFDAAEAGGAILLFDEADALFGKRSEVRDSHDRYANIEVSYLLQRMEVYRGLAILTTNLRSAIDSAFLRRIRFVVQFPFPNVPQRIEIWRRMFPPSLPTAGLDLSRLAQLSVPGGNIRTIALNAAFLAADAGEPLQMKHLLRATQSEYIKLEKTLTETEVGGWI